MTQPNYIALGITGDIQEVDAGGRTFTQTYEDGLFREERAASSMLRRDWRPQKKIFVLDFEDTPTANVDRMDHLYNLKTSLTLQVQEGATLVSYIVKMSPFGRERLTACHGGHWGGMTIELREV